MTIREILRWLRKGLRVVVLFLYVVLLPGFILWVLASLAVRYISGDLCQPP